MKKAIKIFFLTLLIIVIGMVVVRAMISSDKTVFDDFSVSYATAEAYHDAGSDDFTINTLAQKNGRGERGYFMAYSLYHVPATGEVQITVRYNISGAYNYTDTDEDESFIFRLYDEENGKYYEPSSSETKTRYGLYRYIKLTFEEVEADQSTELYLVMENSTTECDRQCVHYKDQPFESYKLKRRDKKEIERLLAI